MNTICRLTFSVLLLLGVHTAAYAQEKQIGTRGELLYSTHCIACHTSQVHWREQKLATDWNSLVTQVRRWQNVTGLRWSEEEVTDVAYHLNGVYYRFKNTVPGKKYDKKLLRN